MEERKDSEKDTEVDEGLSEEELLEKQILALEEEDTSSQKPVVSPDTELPPDEGVDYGTDIPTKDLKKYGFD